MGVCAILSKVVSEDLTDLITFEMTTTKGMGVANMLRWMNPWLAKD